MTELTMNFSQRVTSREIKPFYGEAVVDLRALSGSQGATNWHCSTIHGKKNPAPHLSTYFQSQIDMVFKMQDLGLLSKDVDFIFLSLERYNQSVRSLKVPGRREGTISLP
jgi:hypothetical protein